MAAPRVSPERPPVPRRAGEDRGDEQDAQDAEDLQRGVVRDGVADAKAPARQGGQQVREVARARPRRNGAMASRAALSPPRSARS